MHVLIIPSWYQNKTNTTLGSFFKEQSEALAKKGVKVTVAYPGFNGLKTFGKNQYGKSFEIVDDIPTYRYDSYNLLFDKLPFNLKQFIFNRKLNLIYKKILSEQGAPDIIHAHSALLAGNGAVKLGERFNIPTIVTEHSSAFLIGDIKITNKKSIKYSFQNANKVIAVSNGLKKEIFKFSGRKDIVVVPNIVDCDKFTQSYNNKNEKFTFLTVCYLSQNKGIDILIKAFYKAFFKSNVNLRIVGDGNEKNNLEELVKKLGLGEQVFFTGYASRETVVEEMNGCDAFVLPSRYETFGVVLIEALSCGKPVISTKTAGPIDIIDDQNGILTNIGDIDGLSQAMVSIIDNYKNYNGEEIRKNCIEKYSEDKIITKIINIYEEIITNEVK